jgi:hypothetical protein
MFDTESVVIYNRSRSAGAGPIACFLASPGTHQKHSLSIQFGDHKMSDEQLSQEELDALARLVAESLAKGEKAADISAQLVNSGWEQADADNFVARIALHLSSTQHSQPTAASGEGGAMGWLIWIGVILLINLLSFLFGWGFWVY